MWDLLLPLLLVLLLLLILPPLQPGARRPFHRRSGWGSNTPFSAFCFQSSWHCVSRLMCCQGVLRAMAHDRRHFGNRYSSYPRLMFAALGCPFPTICPWPPLAYDELHEAATGRSRRRKIPEFVSLSRDAALC